MAGRRPKSRAWKLLHGNPGKRALPDDEPTAPPGWPDRPKGLGKDAAAEWQRLAELLDGEKRLTLSDAPHLVGAAVAYGAAVEAGKDAGRRGLSWEERRRARKDARIQWEAYRKFINDMCLSAGTRARAKVGGRGKETTKLQAFQGRKAQASVS